MYILIRRRVEVFFIDTAIEFITWRPTWGSLIDISSWKPKRNHGRWEGTTWSIEIETRRHRGVCTKLAKESDEIIQHPGTVDADRYEVIQGLFEEKLKILNEIDEEILELCDIEDIEH